MSSEAGVIVVFRSYRREGVEDHYVATATRMNELARSMPGYVSHKIFRAEDGESVTIVEFTDRASLEAWSTHSEHVDAKALGRAEFYRSYSVTTADIVYRNTFDAT